MNAYAAAVARALAEARLAWPDVALDDDAFAASVARVAGEVSDAAVAKLRTADLYLATACARGEPAAIAAFDRALVAVIERAVTAAGATPAETTELVQIVRVRLLVAKPGAEPTIATFSARASLASWVKVVATREAARLLAHDRREELASDDELAGHLTAGADPQLEHLVRTYREEFRAAFADAVDALTDRERLLLRQNVLDGVGIDALAELYKIHRATAARWVAAARQSVIEATRAALVTRLNIAPDQLDSILALLRESARHQPADRAARGRESQAL